MDDEELVNLCRSGKDCKKKCDLNHPERPKCRDASDCTRADCGYNHPNLICLFSLRCNVITTCKFRHPFTPTKEKAKSSKPNHKQKPEVSNFPKDTGIVILSPQIPATTTGTNIQAQVTGPKLATPAKTSKKATQKQTPGPPQAPNRPRSMHPEQAKVMAEHLLQIETISDKINALKCGEDFDLTNKKCRGTLEAMTKNLEELESQLVVYREAVSRANSLLKGNELWHQLKREDYRLKSRLPALAKRKEIEELLSKSDSRFIIIQGQTGSGKSTQIAQYIADHPKFLHKRVVVTQPRKIAAIALANRVSMEYSGGSTLSQPGYQVGYHVGGKKISGGKKSRIEFVTEGVMLHNVMNGTISTFQDIGCIVIDEAHERSIICDILLGSFKKEDPRWSNILIVVTSATIDLQQFSQFFNQAPTVLIEGRAFPVDILYNPPSTSNPDPDNKVIRSLVVNSALNVHKFCKLSPGDILCFLPGQEDCQIAKTMFEAELKKRNSTNILGAKAFALFGRQDPEEQAEVFESLANKNQRKVIFATDVAETSITIEGVVYVVDSGVKKEMIFDPKRNISSLRVTTISRSSAIQRAGRCGRTQPGQCVRLYSQKDFEEMSISTQPEIFRRPLSLAILSLSEMNLDPEDFDWLSAPSREAIVSAQEELGLLMAVDEANKVTELGKLVSESQQEPKLVRMIYKACQKGFGQASLTIAAMLSVSNIFFWNGNAEDEKRKAREKMNSWADRDGDVVTMYRIFEQWEKVKRGQSSDPATPEEERASSSLLPVRNDSPEGTGDAIALMQALGLPTTGKPEAVAQLLGKNKEPEPEVKKSVKNYKRLAREWCTANYINGKALGLILSTISELEFLFKSTPLWKAQKQTGSPTNEEINRILFSGYFLHTARLVQSKRSRTHQYFAIHPEVIGNLNFRSAIGTQYSNEDPPSWVIYDKILRISQTILPTTSPISESWMQEESPEFYKLCLGKSATLPTERVVITTSDQIIRQIVGKYFCNLNQLETELECCVDVDLESGILAAYCPMTKKKEVENKLETKVEQILYTLKDQVVEEEYLGGTRVVLGQGYEVKEVLFPQEYSTIYLRNLPSGLSQQFIWNVLTERLTEAVCIGIRSLEVIQQTNSTVAVAVVKFYSKTEAKSAYDILSGIRTELIPGENVEVVPTGLGPKRGVTQGESCRLRVSWATAPSEGKANIAFSTPGEANRFMEQIGFTFSCARVSQVHGEMQSPLGKNAKPFVNKSNKPLPPIIFLDPLGQRPRGTQAASRIRFVTDLDPDFQNYDYKITIADLPKEVDEHEIFLRARPTVPKWIKLFRKPLPDTQDRAEYKQLDELEILSPIQHYTQPNTHKTHFTNKGQLRAGLYIHIEDKQKCQSAYRDADYFSLGHFCGQPYRLEIEYTHSTSVHTELYTFLQKDIDQIKQGAKQRGVIVSEFDPRNQINSNSSSKSRFVVLKFRSCNPNLIREAQGKLEELSSYTKFVYDDIELLFTWTGRHFLTNVARETYIHWNQRTHSVWVYGREEIRLGVVNKLQKIVQKLKALEVIDKPFLLDRKKVDLTNKKNKNNEAKISRLCGRYNLAHFHFNGNKVYASGMKVDVDKLEDSLKSEGYLFTRMKSRVAVVAARGGPPDCNICFCPVESNFARMSVCGHPFCLDCLKPMFDMQPLPFPIKCPGDCDTNLAIGDIAKCAPQGKLRKFVEQAVFKYQEGHGDQILICPKVGCNQLLSPNSKTSGRYGGSFNFCDECITTYCMECSKKLEKPIKGHENESCEDIQNGLSDEATSHVKRIQEQILNLCCPRCKRAFYEFDGCAAVTCEYESCGCHFCGICLQDCGSDAHPHVRQCSKNPTNDFFIDKVQLNRIHKEMRILKLREYFDQIHDVKLKDDVHRAIRKDLMDLGISDEAIGLST